LRFLNRGTLADKFALPKADKPILDTPCLRGGKLKGRDDDMQEIQNAKRKQWKIKAAASEDDDTQTLYDSTNPTG
jgi:hypothetical protein